MNESLPGRIFISYRRQETAWPARQLYDVLVEHFPAEQVFKDVDNIEPGEDFVERITAAVGLCDVLLALIGAQWLTMTDEKGQRRLDNPEDYVRLEIETALTRKIRVIPILVDEARMPGVDELPASLAPLARRNAVEINPITFDTKRLIATVQKTLTELKASDTTAASAAPSSTERLGGPTQQNAGPEVERLYDQALAAYWTEQWDEAVDLLSQVLSRQPDYADAAQKLGRARHQQQLASQYAQASAAADAGDWEQAVAAYTMIADADSGYRDTKARLASARRQHQLASLLAEAHRLHRAGQWAAVIKVGEQLQAIDPDAGDPDRLITSARAELAAGQQAAKLAADYHTGLRLIDAGRWTEAVEALERVTRLDSTYQNAPALLNRARQELAQAAKPAEQQARRQAEEQARRQAEQQARWQSEEQAWRQSKLQAWQLAEVQARRQAEEQARRQSKQRSSRGSGAPSIAPAPPATRAPEPDADRTKSPDKQSRRLSRWPILGGVLIVVFWVLLVVAIVAIPTDILYEDFSSPANGWDDAGSKRAGGHYNNGAYRIYAEPTGEDHAEIGAPRKASSVYPSAPPNIKIYVDAKALAAPESTAYGVACRYGENNNGSYGYAFNVGTNYVSIAKFGIDGSYREIDSQPLPPEFTVNETNSLKADCSSDEGNQAVHLVFKVNDQPVAEGIDSDNPLTEGAIALFAATFKDAKKAVEAEFSNLSVSK